MLSLKWWHLITSLDVIYFRHILKPTCLGMKYVSIGLPINNNLLQALVSNKLFNIHNKGCNPKGIAKINIKLQGQFCPSKVHYVTELINLTYFPSLLSTSTQSFFLESFLFLFLRLQLLLWYSPSFSIYDCTASKT